MRAESTGVPRSRASVHKSIRTLVVDDSPTALKAICAVAKRRGLRVVGTAANGRTALALARSLRPDLVLMDVEMPMMDGMETTSCLQQQCPATRVVIVTVYDSPELRRACRQRGACGFIAKSTLNDELPMIIRGLFENGKKE